MKNQTGTINMSGEKMEVLLEARCVTSCAPALVGRLPHIMSQLCKTLAMSEVSRFFIRSVRIGETVVLVDKINEYTYRIKMETRAVRILDIYDSNHRLRDGVQAVYLVNWGLLRAVSKEMAVAA